MEGYQQNVRSPTERRRTERRRTERRRTERQRTERRWTKQHRRTVRQRDGYYYNVRSTVHMIL
jgi:hypothetical protein